MITIYKYELKDKDVILNLPQGFEILCINAIYGKVYIHAKVNTDNNTVKVLFFTYGTGQELTNTNINYVGTYLEMDGALIRHVYYKTL